MVKNWKIKKVDDELEVKSLSDSLNISEVLARLLVLRKIKTFNDAKKYFRPSLELLYDPFLLNGMDIATNRIIEAITNNQKILIYGDYDVDGTCATAILFLFLKELEANVEFYIPNRIQEGYGISKAGIEFAKSGNASLMISVDCGITALEEADYAKQLGLDLIICDHHQPKDTIPNAYAVLDPLKPGCGYPFKYLAGAGVAFKLAQGISNKIGKKELPFQYLDLVALASSADIVPLVDENRILVSEGLEKINHNPRPGILALIKNSGLELGNLSSGQMVFTLAPRINAVGRLSDAKLAVELLITDKDRVAKELADILEQENIDRKKIDENTLNSALDIVESSWNLKEEIAIVLHEENWHPGVIGIVASRIAEKYYRPTIMLTTIDGVAKGSARSISKFNIYESLKECEDILIHFGGHQAAAGLAVEIEKLEEFKERFNQAVKSRITAENLVPELEIDSRIRLSELTPKFLRIIEQFKPFGPGNMRPTFCAEDVEVTGFPRVVGNNHLLISIKQRGCDKVFDCVGFDLGIYIEKITNPTRMFDLVFSIDQMTRDGKVFPQLKIKDIKLKE
jgi:single-stranded-DNA-specific exonuclease